ncbi:unnamed protein product [Rangifer tarandus platyrhynchus]|uniref:Uncharacterized protein n=1 Tax=Rangifer tarandus platyrhynchus TaxID=3082113 RepID=A0ABN8YQU5_RANTA|nr:unnamed protein product [Rangifer tarandus platyrhynchus]
MIGTRQYICLRCGSPGLNPWVNLKEDAAIHSSILAWRIPWRIHGIAATVHGVHKESDTTEQLAHTQTCHYKSVQTHRMFNIKSEPRDFPRGPVRKPPASTAGVTGSVPGQAPKILHSKWHGQKIFSEKDSEHNGERGIWRDCPALVSDMDLGGLSMERWGRGGGGGGIRENSLPSSQLCFKPKLL